jgi:ubiquinone/menaquinone biosynthesis C-methylase UbiE
VEADEYTRLAEQEQSLWWFKALHANIFAYVDRFNTITRNVRLIDIGSGTGGLVGELRTRYPEWTITGLDMSHFAVTVATEKYGNNFVVGNADYLPFRDDCADIIVSADVLYHRGVTPEQMLREILRVLKPDGVVILNNPAYSWLLSYHDFYVHTARRYTKRRITTELHAAGYTDIHVTYWNTVLFPIMVLKRKIFAWGTSESDVQTVSPMLNAVFSAVSSMEAWVLRRGATLPFGGSILASARKG